MKKAITILGFAVLLAGCYKPYDQKVNVRSGVRSDTLENNIITRPVTNTVSFLIGEGIVVNNVKEARTPEGLIEVQVSGFNQSAFKKVFDYRVDWLDGNGMVIESVMSKWMSVSVMSKSTFGFKVTAPSAKAADYRINTRVTKNMDK
jgi:uncharacterized protein YcfL